jgi:hypothetical protein
VEVCGRRQWVSLESYEGESGSISHFWILIGKRSGSADAMPHSSILKIIESSYVLRVYLYRQLSKGGNRISTHVIRFPLFPSPFSLSLSLSRAYYTGGAGTASLSLSLSLDSPSW